MKYLVTILIFLTGCVTPKQEAKLQKKWVESGACKADTVTSYTSDTTVNYDTTYLTETVVKFNTDTAWLTKPGQTVTKVVTKTIRITDTVLRTVTDTQLEDILRTDWDKAQAELQAYKNAAADKPNLFWWLVLACAVIVIQWLILIKKR